MKLFDPSVSKEQQGLWPAGENFALEQLDIFIKDHLSDYKLERDFPNVRGTSQLSLLKHWDFVYPPVPARSF